MFGSNRREREEQAEQAASDQADRADATRRQAQAERAGRWEDAHFYEELARE